MMWEGFSHVEIGASGQKDIDHIAGTIEGGSRLTMYPQVPDVPGHLFQKSSRIGSSAVGLYIWCETKQRPWLSVSAIP
jgi:hypothetical protein